MNSLQSSAFNLAPPPTLQWQPVRSANFLAIAGRSYPVNTTSAAITVTLPLNPNPGDQITLTDYAGTWSTNNLTISPNGNKLNGATLSGLVSTERGSVNLVYIDSTQGWISYASNLSTTIAQSIPVSFLVIGGGGGGGAGTSGVIEGGGGGAGGFRTGTANLYQGQTYTITVGGGGNSNTDGTASKIVGVGITENPTGVGTNTYQAYGGGAGGRNAGSPNGIGSNGGSGGGGGGSSVAGGKGIYPGSTYINAERQGYDGGTSSGGFNTSAGGGGSSAQGGANSGTTPGAGGNGTDNDYSGSTVTYAGGGGGTSGGTRSGAGGSGGGGAGATSGAGSAASPANRGSGGGAGSSVGSGAGGAGSSGRVIVIYPDTFALAASTTGSPTITTSGGYRRYVFDGNGSITF